MLESYRDYRRKIYIQSTKGKRERERERERDKLKFEKGYLELNIGKKRKKEK